MMGQAISGDFLFEQIINGDGAAITRIAVDDGTIDFGAPGISIITGNITNAGLIIAPAGIAGRLAATVRDWS